MEDNMNDLQLLVHRYPTITDTYERDQLFEKIWNHLQKLTYSLCHSYNINANDLDDIQQELRIKLFTTLTNYQSTRAKFSTYYYHIASNHIKDYLRSYKKRLQTTTPSPDDNFLLEIPDTSNRFSDLEFQQSILSAKTFTAHERHILLLLMRGYRPADIAAKYKLSRTAVSKSCRRIKTKFMQNKELACMASSYVFVKDNFSTVFLWFTKLAPVSYNFM